MSDLILATSMDLYEVDYWADKVRSGLQRSVQIIVETGFTLIAAKEALQHGDWLPMLEKAGINARTAQELMAVAQHPVLGDASTSSHLPTSLGALTALTRLDEGELGELVEAGAITPDLSVRDARDLVKSAAKALAGAMDDDEGSTTEEPVKVAPVARFAEKRDEAVFSVERGRIDDAVAIITAPGFRLTVEVAQDLLRAMRPLEDARSRMLQALEDEVGYLIPLPPYDPPRRVIPVSDPRDPQQVAGTTAFEAAQAPHAQV